MNLYEEKYNEILEWARKNKARLNGVPIEEVLPELAESEDERIRKWLYNYFSTIKEMIWIHRDITCEQILEWLEKQKDLTTENIYKHSRERMSFWNEKQKEQKPEWSEEDEKDMAHIIRILDDCYVYGTHDLSKTDRENLVNKLKSLRPQYHGDVTMTEAYKMGLEAGKASHWKPSEEQMKALLNAEGFLRAGLQHDSAKTIAELYEQLKKL